MSLDREQLLNVIKSTPLVSIDLIIESPEGAVLLGYRNNEPARNFWFVPGGRIHKDETIAAAFTRIACAELGRDVGSQVHFTEARSLGVFEHHYATNFANASGFGTHYIVLAYKTKMPLTIPSPTPDDQHREYRWFMPNEVWQSDEVHEYTKAYLKR